MAGFLERRRQTKEIEREVKFKQGLAIVSTVLAPASASTQVRIIK